MSVLVVGGAGYIGSVLCGHFLAQGKRVRCLDLLVYRHGASLEKYKGDKNFEFMLGDFTDEGVAARALQGVTDVIILAGFVGDPITKKYPQASDAVNLNGMKNFLAGLNGKGLQKVVFVSTCSNYGLIQDNELADEAFSLNPLSAYAKAKVAMEEYLLSQKGKTDYSAVILRFATAFGLSPRMRFDLTVNEFTRELQAGRKLLVYDADTWRPYCHVKDFSRVIQKTLEAPKEKTDFEIFNAGSEVNNFTKRMLVEEITRRFPKASIEYRTYGSDPRNYRVSFKKIRERLGFEPRVTVAAGVEEIAQALGCGEFSDVETNKNFYGNYELDYSK